MDVRPYLILAKTISATHGVSVRFADTDTARCIYSNGKHIIELPFSEAENRDLLYRGYIDHEIGHVRFTKFENTHANELEKALANIFEDEFVERRMGSLFPGSKINLRNLTRHIFNEEHLQGSLQTSAVSRIFAFALYHRRSLLDPELGQWNDQLNEAVRELGVDDSILAQMLAMTARQTNSSEENNQLASDFYRIVEPYLNKELPNQEQDDQQGEGSEDGEQGEQGDQGQDGRQGSQEQQNDQQGEGGKLGVPQITLDDFSVGNCISKELHANPAEVSPLEEQFGEASALTSGKVAECTDEYLKRVGVLVPTDLDESLVSALRKRIPSLLQTSRIKPCVISSRGKLFGKRLARVAVLDTNVFHAPAKKMEQDIEVGFLSDYSGSMDGTSGLLDRAVYASLVMLKELPRVKSFAFGFHGCIYRQLAGKNDKRVREFYGIDPVSSTPLGAAMINVAQEFEKTGRRILIVTTDGHPDRGVEATKEVVRLVERMGIEMYAIGIGWGARYLSDLFGEGYAAVIDNISEYPVRLEAMLRKAMLCVN